MEILGSRNIFQRVVVGRAVQPNHGKLKNRLLIFASAAIGVLSTEFCEYNPALLALWGLMPLLCLEAESCRSAWGHASFLAAFAFYAAVSRGVVPGAYVFFRDGSLIRALTLWLSGAAALAVPWGLLGSGRTKTSRTGAVIFALLASIPPPLGLIGVGNPITAAGLFFPGCGWLGLFLMLTVYAGAAVFPCIRRTSAALILLTVLFLKLPAVPERVTVDGVTFQGINTSFGRMASGSGDFDAQYRRERMIFQYINEEKRSGELEGADVVVLPETVIGRMYPSVIKRWEKFCAPFAQNGMVFITGGEMSTDRGRKYNNVMVSLEENRKRQTAVQRFPVPFSMFRPFSGEGANAYLSSLGDVSVMEVHGKKLGFLVCYEQFLTWPFLSLMTQRPNVILAPANLWWCKDTSLPGIRAAALGLWAELFKVPAVGAVNR